MQVVRTYELFKRSPKHTLTCRVFMPELYPKKSLLESEFPAIIIDFELEPDFNSMLNPSRLRVNCRKDLPTRFMIDEVQYFFLTLKQMYQL